jgi:hypothetical protein
VADAAQHLAVQLGQCRLQAGDRPGGERLGERCVALDEQAGPQGADEGEGLQEPLDVRQPMSGIRRQSTES